MLKQLRYAAAAGSMLVMSVLPAFAQPPGAQTFEVYDETFDGLQVGTDPDIGNVEVVANPGGQGRLIIQTHLQKAAPSCTYDVELVVADETSNGGLDGTGHTGFPQVLGTLTTNKAGSGNAHFDIEVGNGELDVAMYGHLDFEDYDGDCMEGDETTVSANEYGAAPDPVLATPLTWME